MTAVEGIMPAAPVRNETVGMRVISTCPYGFAGHLRVPCDNYGMVDPWCLL